MTINLFKNILFFCLILILSASSCRKKQQKRYEEDPDFSKSTPKERMKGNWLLDDFTFNGTSIVARFNASFPKRKDTFSRPIDIRNSSIQMVGEEGKETINVNLLVCTIGDGRFDEVNISVPLWIFQGKDSIANMSIYSPLHFKDPNILPQETNWRITKLFENNLNIVLDVDSGQYKMLFSK